MKIVKGDKYLCIESVEMLSDGRQTYTRGNMYYSEEDKCITNDQGIIYHEWEGVEYFNRHFKKIETHG